MLIILGFKLKLHRKETSPRYQLHFEEIKEQKENFDIINEGNKHDIKKMTRLNSVKNLNKIHSSILSEMIAHIGMEFETKDLSWQFYLAYAKLARFGVRKSENYITK